MKIKLPRNKENIEQEIDITSIVVVGANGSGKTRFGSDIEKRYNKQTHRISAQKSLSMPTEVCPKSKLRAQSEFLYGYYYENTPERSLEWKESQRWGRNPNTFLLDDYEKLMILLHTDEYEESIRFKNEYTVGQVLEKPTTKLDKIKNIWEDVLPHRKLVVKAGSIETYPSEHPSNKYNASEMSDGERVIFYLIGEVISIPANSIIIIDEPEMHIHKSITKKLWDRIEKERLDCVFIYLTHDIDFAVSRQNSIKIWMKSYEGNNTWDYCLLNEESVIPEQLYLEILGSRKPILFIEGETKSIDQKLLEVIFSDYTVKAVGGCHKVFSSTKNFNDLNSFHRMNAFGLIDRDRRSNDEIENIKDKNIWLAKVAEMENFLLLEEIVKLVSAEMHKNSENVFNEVKENVLEFFNSQIELQATQHTISRIERIFKEVTTLKNIKQFNDLDKNLSAFWSSQNFKSIYEQLEQDFKSYYSNRNYNKVLEIFNNKGIIANSKVSELCDLNSKNEAYLNFIISLIKDNSNKSKIIKNSILQNINKNS